MHKIINVRNNSYFAFISWLYYVSSWFQWLLENLRCHSWKHSFYYYKKWALLYYVWHISNIITVNINLSNSSDHLKYSSQLMKSYYINIKSYFKIKFTKLTIYIIVISKYKSINIFQLIKDSATKKAKQV